MNWNLIKEKYPKAFKKYCEWYFDIKIDDFIVEEHKGIIHISDDSPEPLFHYQLTNYFHRDAYDFFDEQGIIITVDFEWYYNDLDGQEYEYFDYLIITGKDDLIHNSDREHKTRTEAEEQAFLKAFELLENKL